MKDLTLPQVLVTGGIVAATVLVTTARAVSLAYAEHSKGKPAVIERTSDTYTAQRKSMVENQLKSRGIYDEKLLDAMQKVERHKFIPENLRAAAYRDHAVPIGYGQTISQPYIVAYMTQCLELKGDEKVLEIGTGSGYQSAVLNEIVNQVYSIEIIKELADRADKTLNSLGYSVKVKNADGYYGWPEYAPFDAIMITAATNHIPPPLINQLSDNGRLIMPLGTPFFTQWLTFVEKKNNELKMKQLIPVIFVPMTGRAMEGETEK